MRAGKRDKRSGKKRAAALALLMLPGAAGAVPKKDPLEALQRRLPDKVQKALAQMDGPDRQLLAVRSYLRGVRSIDDRWSWTEEEIAAYLQSDANRRALEAVDKVIKAFEQQNPGYSLHVNTKVRSLHDQIDKWNRNSSVAAGAVELGAALELWRRKHPKATEAQTSAFLAGWRPTRQVSLAAPGLSSHGRARAFDFQVMKGGTIIAATNMGIIESVWDGEGWTEKLAKAVKASKAAFKGPLDRPREPWHYEYCG